MTSSPGSVVGGPRPPRWSPRLVLFAVLAPGVALAACGESNDVVYTADRVEVSAGVASTTAVPNVEVPADTIVIDRIWSPAGATAEVIGTGAVPGDPVTVDGEPADVESFDLSDDGVFTIRIRIEESGARTVCVRDECGRVFVVGPDGED